MSDLSKSVEFGTPDKLFEGLSLAYGPFDLDLCASHATPPKTLRYFDVAYTDALAQDWAAQSPKLGRVPRCWMNPPYGRQIGLWTKKAALTGYQGGYVVGLLPAHTDTGWWHRDVMPVLLGRVDGHVQFLRGRVAFTHQGKPMGPARFPNVVVAWGRYPQEH